MADESDIILSEDLTDHTDKNRLDFKFTREWQRDTYGYYTS